MSFWTPERVGGSATTFVFEATAAACVGRPDRSFLMGGVAMAAAVEAAEQATGRPLLWATIQFISGGAMGDRLRIEVEELAGGRSVSQVCVSLFVGDRMIQRLLAALGGRDGAADTQFLKMPEAPPPERCPLKTDAFSEAGGCLISQFERRTAFECDATGVEHMWIRPVVPTPMNAGLLAITSDFFLGAHRRSRSGSSLDNTLRVFSRRETEWILCAVQFSGFSDGAAMGVKHQFAQDGTLLSTSSQTGLLPREKAS